MKTEEQRLLDELYDKEQRWDNSDTKVSIKKEVKHPDARLHQIVSFIKSGVRILGYIFLPIDLYTAAIILILSEVIGIYEELV